MDRFQDRADAGRYLAELLKKYADSPIRSFWGFPGAALWSRLKSLAGLARPWIFFWFGN